MADVSKLGLSLAQCGVGVAPCILLHGQRGEGKVEADG